MVDTLRGPLSRAFLKASFCLHIPSRTLTSCVTLGELLNLSEPQFTNVLTIDTL